MSKSLRYRDFWPKVYRRIHPQTGAKCLLGYSREGPLPYVEYPTQIPRWTGPASQVERDFYLRQVKPP
jgi:hypothetical protein